MPNPTPTGSPQVASEWRANFDLNVVTTVLLTEALLPHLARPGGRIVSMSSVAGLPRRRRLRRGEGGRQRLDVVDVGSARR